MSLFPPTLFFCIWIGRGLFINIREMWLYCVSSWASRLIRRWKKRKRVKKHFSSWTMNADGPAATLLFAALWLVILWWRPQVSSKHCPTLCGVLVLGSQLTHWLSHQLPESVTKLIIFVSFELNSPLCIYPCGLLGNAQQCFFLPIFLKSIMLKICK